MVIEGARTDRIMKNRKYTPEFKRQAVELANDLDSTSEAARQLGVSDANIHGWRAKLQKVNDQSKQKTSNESEELQRLRRENSDLKKVNHILKAAAAFFSQDHLK